MVERKMDMDFEKRLKSIDLDDEEDVVVEVAKVTNNKKQIPK